MQISAKEGLITLTTLKTMRPLIEKMKVDVPPQAILLLNLLKLQPTSAYKKRSQTDDKTY